MAAYSDFEQRQMDAASGCALDRAAGRNAFACPFCGAVSHNPNDLRERYCGRCHVFTDQVLAHCRDRTGKIDHLGGCLVCSADAGVACRHPASAAIARATGDAG
jgi:hypothetical protein